MILFIAIREMVIVIYVRYMIFKIYVEEVFGYLGLYVEEKLMLEI